MKLRARRRRICLCQACGKLAHNRRSFRDTSCMTWGVYVWKDSLKFRHGRLIRAKACKVQSDG